MNKKVLIIGAGVGGLTTAVRLLSRGYEVKIFEKEKTIGGKVNFIKKDDFCFDLTASILLTPENYKEVFDFSNKNYKDYLEFIRLDPIYRVNYYDGSSYDISSDLVKLTETIESISKEDSQGYLEFLSNSYRKYLIANKYFLQKSFQKATDFFNPNTLIKALEIRTFSNTYTYISKFIKNEKLRDYLCFLCLYVGISPYHGPNIYTLVPAISQLHGLWHLSGGMYSYIKALNKVVVELGGTIETSTNVNDIVISQGKAVGLNTSKGIEKGDIIVCNADFSYAMKELITNKKAKSKYTDEKISKMKYSCSTVIIYLALKKKYPQLLVHNLYLGENFKQNIDAPFKGQLPLKPSLYIYCPSRIDKSMAPKERECLNIMVRVPNLSFDHIKWNKQTIRLLRTRIFDAISKIKGLDDIEENIIYERYLTPNDLLTTFNSYNGAAFGLSHTLTQTNYFRPHIKSETVENLYFVGGSVQPGTGVSIVLQSSKLVAEEIMKVLAKSVL